MSLVTGLFCLVLLLNQRWSPPLRLQASHCSTFRIMCDVPSIAVFYSESIECLPGTASKFFFKFLVTIPEAPIITGITVHFRFHIRCICIYKLSYFNFFSASFCTTFLSAGLLLLLLLFVWCYFCIYYVSWFCCNLDKRYLSGFFGLRLSVWIHQCFPIFLLIFHLRYIMWVTKSVICGPGDSVGIATELRAGRSGTECRRGRDFPPAQTGPGAHPASCKIGRGSFSGVKCGRGVLLTTHPLLVPQSWKSRAIPLPTLWATPGL